MATKPKVPELGTDTAPPPPAPSNNGVPDLGTAPLTPPPVPPAPAGVQSDTSLTQPQSAPQPKVGEEPADETAVEPPVAGETDDEPPAETEGEQPLPPDQPSPVLTEAARGTPSLALANAPGIGNGIGGNPVNPLDHDGDGKAGGSIPAGATRDYSTLLAAEATANAKATELQAEVVKLRAENTGLRKQLSNTRASGDEALADTIIDKMVERFGGPSGGSRRNASGGRNTPPQDIDDLRTPGINQ